MHASAAARNERMLDLQFAPIVISGVFFMIAAMEIHSEKYCAVLKKLTFIVHTR